MNFNFQEKEGVKFLNISRDELIYILRCFKPDNKNQYTLIQDGNQKSIHHKNEIKSYGDVDTLFFKF